MKLGMFLSPGSYPHRSLAEVIAWYEQVVRRADELGYDEIWCASHTNSMWARIASPSQLIARFLGMTERVKFGTAAEIMYMHNPIALAARLAELDQISKGRMYFGFAAGGPVTDMQLYAVPGKNVPEMRVAAHEMMLEGIEAIINCWQPGGPQDFDGKYYKVRRPPAFADMTNSQKGDYGWHLSPYGPFENRIAIAGLQAKSTGLSMAGERGFIPMSWTISQEFASANWQSIAEGASRAGRVPSRKPWRFTQMVYVAESEKEARKQVVEGFAGIYYTKMWAPIFDFNGAGAYLKRRAGTDRTLSTEDLIDMGFWYVGTPDKVEKQIREQYKIWGGFGTILQVGFDYAGEGSESWLRGMDLLAKEVMPKLSDLDDPDLPQGKVAA
jgi:alkanesulfonate monooxygenase SsuD/methylene tetrahydromethanopterin reductase-like flavin-dependent oxidoreductase (luciferase family)